MDTDFPAAEGLGTDDKYLDIIPDELQAAYYRLIYYPAVATTNIIKIQLYAGLNKAYANLKLTSANYYADLMDQAKNAAHIGYPGWEPKGSYPTATKLKTSYLGPQESYRK